MRKIRPSRKTFIFRSITRTRAVVTPHAEGLKREVVEIEREEPLRRSWRPSSNAPPLVERKGLWLQRRCPELAVRLPAINSVSRIRRIYFVAGEASGDEHGAV